MASKSKLLKFLELSFQHQQHHHSTLWEEEKHYSWWIYIIFAGLIFVYVNRPLIPWQNISIIAVGSAFGAFISLIGYAVVRRESEYFHEAIQMHDRIIVALGLDQPVTRPDGASFTMMPPNQITIKDWGSVKSQANKPLRQLIAGILKRNLGIRDCFQLTFATTAFLFIVFGIFSVITILLNS